MRILIAEDDTPLANFVRQQLQAEGYEVTLCADGNDACTSARRGDFDLVVLDLTLPGSDGLAVLKQLRIDRPAIPILILTAIGRVESRVQCLDAGADDYVVKPFSLAELSARIRALLRRSHSACEMVLTVGDLQLNRVERRVERAGGESN